MDRHQENDQMMILIIPVIIIFLFLLGKLTEIICQRITGEVSTKKKEKPDFRLELDTDNIAGVEHATIHSPDGSMVNLVRVTMKDGTEGVVRTIHGGEGRLIGGENEVVSD